MYKGERMNSITHLIGASLALAALVVLVVHSSLKGDPWRIVSFSVYGTTLVALYTLSTLYHSLQGAVKKTFQKLDHAAIYLLIAGTYTPFSLVSLRGPWGWTVFGVIWGLAVAGMSQDVLLKKRRHVISVSFYIIMGWFALAAIRPLARVLPASAMIWLFAGGIFYTVGVIFYALDKKMHYGHEIFHLFVLGGSMCHFITIFLYVA